MKKTALILLSAIILGLGGFYVYNDYQKTKNKPEETKEEQPKENQEVDGNSTTTETEEVKKTVSDIKAPDLNGKIITAEMEKIISELKADPYNSEKWIMLGVLRKNAGDYEGAKDCWIYAIAINPENYLSYNNLGNLYAYYLKDNQKAEEYFLKALELAPKQSFVYSSIHDFYADVVGDEAKADEILKGLTP